MYRLCDEALLHKSVGHVKDGLKPVQRRILYAMIELNKLTLHEPHRSCARIVVIQWVNIIRTAIHQFTEAALVNLAQEWSTRYPLVDGHGASGGSRPCVIQRRV